MQGCAKTARRGRESESVLGESRVLVWSLVDTGREKPAGVSHNSPPTTRHDIKRHKDSSGGHSGYRGYRFKEEEVLACSLLRSSPWSRAIQRPPPP